MSSTNKTITMNLSQFLPNDIPAWLTDYNADMLKIDNFVTTIKDGYITIDGKVNALDGEVTSLSQTVGTLTISVTDIENTLGIAVNDIQVLKDGYISINQDVIQIKNDISNINSSISGLQSETSQLSSRVNILETEQRSKLINTSGWLLENPDCSLNSWNKITNQFTITLENGIYALSINLDERQHTGDGIMTARIMVNGTESRMRSTIPFKSGADSSLNNAIIIQLGGVTTLDVEVYPTTNLKVANFVPSLVRLG